MKPTHALTLAFALSSLAGCGTPPPTGQTIQSIAPGPATTTAPRPDIGGACDSYGRAALNWEAAHLHDGTGEGCWSDLCGSFVYNAAVAAGKVPAWLAAPANTANDMMNNAIAAGVFHDWDGSCPCGAILFYEAHSNVPTGHVVLCNGDGTVSSSGWPGWPNTGPSYDCGFDGDTSTSLSWLNGAEGIAPTGYVLYGGTPAGPPPAIPPAPTGCGAIQSGHGLGPGTSAHSCDGRFSLAMQNDGNLVVYSYGVPLWATGTNGGGGDVAVMQADGNFVEYSTTSVPLFASGTNGHSGATLSLQDDGNVVVYAAGKALWATGTNDFAAKPTACGAITPAHGLSAGESVSSCDGRFMLVMQGDENLVLYENGSALWQSDTVGSGARSLEMQTDGNLVLYAAHHQAVWSSRTNGNAGATLALQNDGNLVIYLGSRAIWATGTND